jgi:DNA-directed RNA polymerase subunit RPC12/RpoP
MTSPYQLDPGPQSRRSRNQATQARTSTTANNPTPGRFALRPSPSTGPSIDPGETVTRHYQCITCASQVAYTRPATQPGRKPDPMPVTQAITAGWAPRQTGWVCPACTSKGAPS